MISATPAINDPNFLLTQLTLRNAQLLEPLTVTQVELMLRHGILHEGAPVELIDGLLIRKDRSALGGDPTKHDPRHAYCISCLQQLLLRVESIGCQLLTQLPIVLSEFRVPEPDMAIVQKRADRYRDQHPGLSDTFAVIEAADGSLEFDRTVKQALYANAGIPWYGIVNLRNGVVEMYEKPDRHRGKYGVRRERQRGETIKITLPGGASIPIRVDEIIG